MSSFTKNLEYQGHSMPFNTICPPELNEHIKIRRLPATADVASTLCAGVACYLSGTTNANDMTACTDEWGSNASEGMIYFTEIMEHDPNFATTTDQPEFPNRLPNTSVTLANYAPAENKAILVIPAVKGMFVWLLIANAVNASVTKDTMYNITAADIIGAIDDPTPDAITKGVHGFRAVATVTNYNWALFEYVGIVPIDTT
jgi:hypothetical protein